MGLAAAGFLVTAVCLVCVQPSLQTNTKTLLVSMDGFRWDYLKRASTPNIDRMAREGVQAPYIYSTFVTKSFPNHFSIVTGLYQESHGIVGNGMYDPELDAHFWKGVHTAEWWDVGAEPIWQTARMQGRKTASYFWPGSEAPIKGMHADIWLPYNESHSAQARIDRVIGWFVEEDVDIVTLYLEEPDAIGHAYGADGPEVIQKSEEMDGILGYLFRKVSEAGLEDSLNILLVSDHGMATISTDRVISLYDYVNKTWIDKIPDFAPLASILPVSGHEDDVVNALQDAHPNMTVYRKEDLPARLHYSNHRRIMPLLAVTDEGWLIVPNKSELTPDQLAFKGMHGWDPEMPSMRTVFLARGPSFRRGHRVAPFHNIDIYNLLCHLVDVTPAPNNGSWERVRDLLVEAQTESSDPGASVAMVMTPNCPLLFGIFVLLASNKMNLA